MGLHQTLSILALIFLVNQAAHANSQNGPICLEGYKQILPKGTARAVETNQYKVNRGISAYRGAFRSPKHPEQDSFGGHLNRLRPDQHWLDVGCGLCRAAMQFFEENGLDFTAPWRGNAHERLPRVTGLVLSDQFPNPEHHLVTSFRDMQANAPPRHPRIIVGTPVEYFPDAVENVGRADIITDVFGAFSYSPRIDQVLDRYLELLEPNGAAYIMIPPNFNSINIKNAAGQPLRIDDYLAKVRGANVEVVHVEATANNPPRSYFVMRRNDEPIHVPRLELRSMESGTPPRRFYRLP